MVKTIMKTNIPLKRIILIIMALLALGALLVIGTDRLDTPPHYPVIELADGWQIHGNGIELEDVTPVLSGIKLNKKGDTVTMVRRLPEYDDIISPCIMFTTSLSRVIVHADDEELYSYGHEQDAQGDLVPNRIHFIPLEGVRRGAELSITITATESNAYLTLPKVTLGNVVDLRRQFVEDRRFPLFAAVFMCMLAIILLILSSYLFVMNSRDLSMVASAVISFVLGTYVLCYNDILNFITDREEFFTVAEYLSLYIAPLMLLAFICIDQSELFRNEKMRFRLILFLGIDALFPTVAFSFHLGNLIHINRFLPFMHVICIVEFVILIPTMFKTLSERLKSYKEEAAEESDSTAALSAYTRFMSMNSLLAGILSFMLFALIDILRYNIRKYIGGHTFVGADINFLIFGGVFFVLCLLLNCFFHSVQYLRAGSERERLEGLAYSDPLTGLSNRARCEELMGTLKGDYTVISIDMDNLKHINDQFGHEEGDRMLASFAKLLEAAFPDAKLLGRTGGDEFTAAFAGVNKEMCEERLAELQDDIDRFNSEDHPFKMSASWGYATSNERRRAGDTSIDVYKLADARMYNMKENHHNQRLRRILADIHASGQDDVN